MPAKATPSARARAKAGGYRTIVADPPWVYEPFVSKPGTPGRQHRVKKALAFDSMSVEQIAALDIASLAHPEGTFLFVWTTNRYLPATFRIIEDWGFQYKQTIVWSKGKDHCFVTSIAPNHAEFLLLAKRGRPRRIGSLPSSVVEANRTKQHSRKPGIFLDQIEQACPGPYLELFARRARPGWDCWGDEAPNPIEWAA